jgi:hypothetical protein
VESKLRERLSRAVYRGRSSISDARWRFLLEHRDLGEDIREFREEKWKDLFHLVQEKLEELDRYEEHLKAEREGRSQAPSLPRGSALGNQPELTDEELEFLDVLREDLATPLGSRTRARAETLRMRDEIHSERPVPYNRTPLSRAVLPRGGTDGTAAQWVALIAIELWTPAEELKASYQSLQESLTEEKRPPKTEERAYEVARFVMSVRRHRPRYPWRSLLEHWNLGREKEEDRFTGKAAEQTFRKVYDRGMRAALPRYEKSEKHLRAFLERGPITDLFDGWAKGIRKTFE